jgi:hypothetical protein
MAAGQIVPETFGFIHEGVLRPGFSDWVSVTGSTGAVTFRSRFAQSNGAPLTIQVIGTPIGLPAGASARALTGEQQDDCPEPPAAHVVRLPDPGTDATVQLTVLPSVNCAARIHGLAIRRDPPQDGRAAEYSFRPVQRSRPAGRFVIRTTDGELLTDAAGNGRPSKAAERLGLLPIIGASGGDSFSLTGLLSATKLPLEGLEVEVTIDARIQAVAQEAVSWGITRFGNDKWASERKSALVILDADNGAILAVAGHPTIPPGLADWDLPSFSAAFPLRDPSTILAWEVIDKHNTPGSTFKPVTALAAMMETDPEFRERIGPVLRGLDSGALRAATGLSFGSSSYVAYQGAKAIPNFGGSTLGRYAGRPSRDSRCLVDDPEAQERASNQPSGFGLRHATQFSLNAWYGRLALMIEQERIDDFARRVDAQDGPRIPAPEMTLTRTARYLGIDDREHLDLAANVPESVGLHRYAGDAHDVLYAQLARSTLAGMAYNQDDWGARPLVMYTAALNGIGQTVSASPLHMALVAAAIASGEQVRPHLIASWAGSALPPGNREPLPVDPEQLEILRDGMKAVPEVGTAPRALPRPLACRVYGKTGTAEIDAARSYNSGWFIGWQEPAAPDEKRLAFACMTTHAIGGYRFGGTACAPVVSRVLQEIEHEPEPEPAPEPEAEAEPGEASAG